MNIFSLFAQLSNIFAFTVVYWFDFQHLHLAQVTSPGKLNFKNHSQIFILLNWQSGQSLTISGAPPGVFSGGFPLLLFCRHLLLRGSRHDSLSGGVPCNRGHYAGFVWLYLDFCEKFPISAVRHSDYEHFRSVTSSDRTSSRPYWQSLRFT